MIISINKPINISSNRALTIVKQAFMAKYNIKKQKMGHAGTLDPLASGVLVLLSGHDTKKQEIIMHSEKSYRARIAFGVTSKTYDLESDLTIQSLRQSVTAIEKTLPEVLNAFVGEISQTVPAFSAVKISGKHLYELARKENIKDMVLPVRRVIVKSIETLSLCDETIPGTDLLLPVFSCNIVCGHGFYVRSFANDLGAMLGLGGVLIELVRTRVGNFKVEDALELSKIDTLI